MKPVEPIIPNRELPVTRYAEGQPEYETLPSWKSVDGLVLSRWHLSFWERVRVLFVGDVYLWISTHNRALQPVSLQVEPPGMVRGTE